MKIVIDRRAIPVEEISFREMGFGEAIPTEQAHRYLIRISRTRMVELLGKSYAELITDQQRDDSLVRDPFPKYFKDMGYPSFQELMGHPRHFEETIKAYLWDDFMKGAFKGVGQSVKWVLNSIDSVLVRRRVIEIRGEALHKAPLPNVVSQHGG